MTKYGRSNSSSRRSGGNGSKRSSNRSSKSSPRKAVKTTPKRSPIKKSPAKPKTQVPKKKTGSKVFTDKKGYKRYKDSGKTVHRHVAEKKLGRKLNTGEVVHHKNRDKQDNRRSNLWVFKSQKDHHDTHVKDKKKTGKW